MASPALPTTAEALLTFPLPATQVELVRGQVVVREPPGQRHGGIVGGIYLALALHLREEQRANGWTSARGRLVIGDAGYILERQPDTVRGPDVAYLSRARLDLRDGAAGVLHHRREAQPGAVRRPLNFAHLSRGQ